MMLSSSALCRVLCQKRYSKLSDFLIRIDRLPDPVAGKDDYSLDVNALNVTL